MIYICLFCFKQIESLKLFISDSSFYSEKMASCYQGCVFVLAMVVLALSTPCSHALRIVKPKTRTSVFVSPKFVLEPGSVADKNYYDVNFPRGHIAIKSFNGEVIDEEGNPIPLHETYLHHWVVGKYYGRIGFVEPEDARFDEFQRSDFAFVRNSGVCQGDTNGQYFGIGSETRRTDTHVPDPFGIEVGNPAVVPAGYEERWLLNVHAIDTRGAENGLGCTECRCDLYNVSTDSRGQPLRPGYKGGLRCCYDGTHCRVKQGFNGVKRNLYLRYTVKWVDWSDSIIPVKIYIFDVTDKMNRSAGLAIEHECRVEYDVEESCSETSDGCIDSQSSVVTMPTGGYVVYGVAHQHTGGIRSTLYGEDGRVLCSSIPIYGKGKEAGDEAGYIVGMSTCYPQPGSVKINDGETLTLVSNYSSSQTHTGVMDLFYVLVADYLPKSSVLSLDSTL
ncbi:uncharacterized protein LOC126599842 isoform X1 [Malus sylvestris]|uniref:uncharacterized protein LOC126599842 isoform X1 n=1 Tax=Malus sylvestris TaxID=3752 RepID=UPI0021ABDBDB|nr:uncharacterized protein LOC126599842 isoform X1 [Malus sylvestris]XP_050122248.1 uncharacterized protein LOC126599842 isoform X1 [Malus sylvestris]